MAWAATKAGRFVEEMRQIAATQAAAGLTPALFEAFADVCGCRHDRPGSGDPESATGDLPPTEIARRLRSR